MMTAIDELEKAMSRCKISRTQRPLHAQRSEGSAAREANTTRLDDAGDKKPEARSRTEDCHEQAKTPELQNTVMNDRRADPQRVRRADPQRVKRA